MAIVVTGARGFIGQNLMVRLAERGLEAIAIGSGSTAAELRSALQRANFVFHLAGVNRPREEGEFVSGNVDFTRALADILALAGHKPPVVYASSIQAERDNPYGRSKLAAEAVLQRYAETSGAAVRIFRFPNVFGKWARQNYNSAVATFCHNIAKGLPIAINDPSVPLRLIHVDDACAALLELLDQPLSGFALADAGPVHSATVGQIAEIVRGFAESRSTLMTDRVGGGLRRALYSTYLSYIEPGAFAYDVPRHADSRGVFVEMLKTPDCGQISYFTAGPGVTRGGHYHHTKTEKFLVLSGEARFRFRHIITNQRHEIITRGGDGRIVETIPGWAHDITNTGDADMVVMLWANEVFDHDRPDTIAQKV